MRKDDLTQEVVSKTAEMLMVKKNLRPGEVTGYAVGKALGKAGGNHSVQSKVQIWRRAKEAELARPVVQVPSAAKDALKKVVDDQAEAFLEAAFKVLSDGYTAMQAAAELKNAAITQVASDADLVRQDLMNTLEQTEADLERACAERDEWEAKFKAAEKEASDLHASNATLRELFAAHYEAPHSEDKGTSPAVKRPSDETSAGRAAPATEADSEPKITTVDETNDKVFSAPPQRDSTAPHGNQSVERRQNALPLIDPAVVQPQRHATPSSATGTVRPPAAPRPNEKPQDEVSGSDDPDAREGGA